MSDNAQATLAEDYGINAVIIDADKNQIDFMMNGSPKPFWGGSWSIHNRETPIYLQETHRDFWRPFDQVPVAIAYMNYKLWTTHVLPQDKRVKADLEKVLQEQIQYSTDISADMRQSIDTQINSITTDQLNVLFRRGPELEF